MMVLLPLLPPLKTRKSDEASVNPLAPARVEPGPAVAEVVEMAELDGTGTSRDEGDGGADRDLDERADPGEIAAGVAAAGGVVAVEADALEAHVGSQRDLLIHRDVGAGQDGTEPGPGIDGEG